MESGAILLDVRLHRQEVVLDERGDIRVAIGFGFQPNTSCSIGGGGEIEQ